MFSSTKNRFRQALTICALLFLSGCQSVMVNPIGHMVREEKTISIPDSGESSGVYDNDDMVLNYRMVRTGGQLNISGRLQFTRRIGENFPVIRYFHLNAILVDAQGKVQDVTALASAANYYSEYITPSDPPITFSKSMTVFDSTKSLAFSYAGQAYDPTGNGAVGTDFWEYPFK